MWAQDFDAASAYARRAIEIGDAAGAAAAVSGGYLTAAYVNGLSGRRRSRDPVRGIVAHQPRGGRRADEILTLQMQGVFDGWHGDYARAGAKAEEAVRLARDAVCSCSTSVACGRAGSSTSLGDWDGARRDLEEGIAVAERIGDRGFMPSMLNTLGWLHIECDDVEHGIAVTSRAACMPVISGTPSASRCTPSAPSISGMRFWRRAI